MKGELEGKIMTGFVALTPKSYAYRKLDNKEDKKCKGIKKCVMKKTFDFDDYKNCLLDVKSKSIYKSQLMFRNNKHEIHTVEVNKVALNRDDDKRIVRKDGISILVRDYYPLCWNSLLGVMSQSLNPLELGTGSAPGLPGYVEHSLGSRIYTRETSSTSDGGVAFETGVAECSIRYSS